MRGQIPRDRMDQIHSNLPASIELSDKVLHVVSPLIGADRTSHDAQVRFQFGWQMLNQTHLALTEAEACWVWHLEFRQPPNAPAARYFAMYYIDDAALRLYASREHLLIGIGLFFCGLRYKGQGTAFFRVLQELENRKCQSQIVRP